MLAFRGPAATHESAMSGLAGVDKEFAKSCQTSLSAAKIVWNLLDWAGATQHARHVEKAVVRGAPFTVDSMVYLLLIMESDLLVRLGQSFMAKFFYNEKADTAKEETCWLVSFCMCSDDTSAIVRLASQRSAPHSNR